MTRKRRMTPEFERALRNYRTALRAYDLMNRYASAAKLATRSPADRKALRAYDRASERMQERKLALGRAGVRMLAAAGDSMNPLLAGVAWYFHTWDLEGRW